MRRCVGQFHIVGEPMVRLSATNASKKSARVSRRVEHQGARHLNLAHSQFPPVASGAASGLGQGDGSRLISVWKNTVIAPASAVATRLAARPDPQRQTR